MTGIPIFSTYLLSSASAALLYQVCAPLWQYLYRPGSFPWCQSSGAKPQTGVHYVRRMHHSGHSDPIFALASIHSDQALWVIVTLV